MTRIALVVFGDPHRLPPTLNAARILDAHGWEVDLIGVRWRDRPQVSANLPRAVRVHLDLRAGPGPRQLLDYGRFCTAALELAKKRRPDWIYAYDCMAAPVGFAMARSTGARFAYHCHDFAQRSELARTQRWLQIDVLEKMAARRADIVVFPQAERALDFDAAARLSRPPLVVYNCPALDWIDDDASVDPIVAEHRTRWPRLVLYQGGLSASLGVGALVSSLPSWPKDAGLVLVGDATRPAAILVREQAEKLGVGSRILWRGLVAHHELPRIGRLASLGVLLTRSSHYNLVHLAGASNKVFEYMACGLPVLVPDSVGFAELIETPGHGEVCRDLEPLALARQIGRLLDDRRRAEHMSALNRVAFRTHYHYEAQWQKVLAALDQGRTAST